MPNPLKTFMAMLRKKLPEVELDLDEPKRPDAPHWLEASCNDRHAVIEWRPGRGFGISRLPSEGFGEGHEELAETPSKAAKIAFRLLNSTVEAPVKP